MRWQKWHAPIGQYRRRHRFLFLPRTVGEEVRWLEWATILQQYACGAGWMDRSFDPVSATPKEVTSEVNECTQMAIDLARGISHTPWRDLEKDATELTERLERLYERIK